MYRILVYDCKSGSTGLDIKSSDDLALQFNLGEITEETIGLAVYYFEAPKGTNDRTISLMAKGILFEHDWTNDGIVLFVKEC